MLKQIDTACPVLALATQYEALAQQYHVATSSNEEVTLSARLAELAEAASCLSPNTREGAAFQIMLASAEVDTIPGGAHGSQVWMSKLIVQRLAYRALDLMRDELARFPHARDFMMPADLDPRKGE